MSGGCLPLLLGSAKTLNPGDYSLAIAGMARTHTVPDSVKQTGTFNALIDLRGGLLEGVESGLLLQVPSHVAWDLKGRILRESDGLVPAMALRAHLGIIQPSFGVSMLATKTFGRTAVTLMAGASRTNERLWREASGPFASESENFVKRPLELGCGAEYRLTSVHYLFCDAITWYSDPDYQIETPKTGSPFGVTEKRNWFFAAGIRIRWTPPPKPKPKAVSVALRGRVLKEPDAGQFEVGQPGIYSATVYVDAHTLILKEGKPVKLEELTQGRAVLIQGLPLPRPATFLARTIELQQ